MNFHLGEYIRTICFNTYHQLYDFSRLLGLRNRLRCKICNSIGAFKPHGGWLDFEDERPMRRWLCKWCGFYADRHTKYSTTFAWCEIDEKAAVWTITEKSGTGSLNTPQNKCMPMNPWRG